MGFQVMTKQIVVIQGRKKFSCIMKHGVLLMWSTYRVLECGHHSKANTMFCSIYFARK